MTSKSFNSVVNTVLPGANPVRFETRKTCVSTAIVGLSNPSFNTTLAVFRPTPGSCSNSSRVPGILPACFSRMILQVFIIFLDLAGASPMGLIIVASRDCPIASIATGVGHEAKRVGVTLLTVLSVD